MKKRVRTFCIVLALLLVALPVFAVQVSETILVLYSGATGTTSQVTGDVVYAPYVFSSAGCDIITSPSVTVTVLFRGGNARGTTTFDGSGLASASTCTTGACNVQFTSTLRAMDALITAGTTTVVVDVNCAVAR